MSSGADTGANGGRASGDNATIATPSRSISRDGKCASAAIATIDQPITQITCKKANGGPKLKPNETNVTSRNTSHSPRARRKRDSGQPDFPLAR